MKKYQELENKIKQLQEEVERLKKEEKDNQLPTNFNRENAIKLLEKPDDFLLDVSFLWTSTPQGEDYWLNLGDKLENGLIHKLPDEAVIQIQKWVIQSYKEQYGV